MTDDEIIKALECCSHRNVDLPCEGCPAYSIAQMCMEDLMSDAIDLINRQNAEIERLDQESGILEEELEDRSKDIYDLISKERSNAILEFAEALKQESEDDFVSVDLIDSVVKDMTEVEE